MADNAVYCLFEMVEGTFCMEVVAAVGQHCAHHTRVVQDVPPPLGRQVLEDGQRCTAVKRDGQRCNFRRRPGGETCGVHVRPAPAPAPVAPPARARGRRNRAGVPQGGGCPMIMRSGPRRGQVCGGRTHQLHALEGGIAEHVCLSHIRTRSMQIGAAQRQVDDAAHQAFVEAELGHLTDEARDHEALRVRANMAMLPVRIYSTDPAVAAQNAATQVVLAHQMPIPWYERELDPAAGEIPGAAMAVIRVREMRAEWVEAGEFRENPLQAELNIRRVLAIIVRNAFVVERVRILAGFAPPRPGVVPPAAVGLARFVGDAQNVHTVEANAVIADAGQRLVEVDGIEGSLAQIGAMFGQRGFGTPTLRRRVVKDMSLWYKDAKVMAAVGVMEDNTFGYRRMLDKVWGLILKSKDREDLEQRLWEEAVDSVGMCTQGHMTRLANVLQGFEESTKGPKVEVSKGERLQTAMAQIAEMPEAERVSAAQRVFVELEVAEGERGAWLEALTA